MPDETKTTNTLTDEEVAQVSGGAAFNKCSLGHYEATSIANALGVMSDCKQNRCGQCEIKLVRIEKTKIYADEIQTDYIYSFHCGYFNRTINQTFSNKL